MPRFSKCKIHNAEIMNICHEFRQKGWLWLWKKKDRFFFCSQSAPRGRVRAGHGEQGRQHREARAKIQWRRRCRIHLLPLPASRSIRRCGRRVGYGRRHWYWFSGTAAGFGLAAAVCGFFRGDVVVQDGARQVFVVERGEGVLLRERPPPSKQNIIDK